MSFFVFQIQNETVVPVHDDDIVNKESVQFITYLPLATVARIKLNNSIEKKTHSTE